MRFVFMLLSINITWPRWCNMFLDERFFHNCALTKRSLIRFADWSFPKTLDIFYCGSTKNAVCVFFGRFGRIIHSICADFILQRFHVLISQHVAHASESTRWACVLRTYFRKYRQTLAPTLVNMAWSTRWACVLRTYFRKYRQPLAPTGVGLCT